MQRLAVGSRDSCSFDAYSADAAAVCHEVRCPGLTPADKPFVSFKASGGGNREVHGHVGDICTLKSVDKDAVVVFRIWASSVPSQGTRGQDHLHVDSSEGRRIGEVRIPLRRVAKAYDGMLYHCWLLVGDAGSQGDAFDDEEVFDRALREAPHATDEPRVRLTFCRPADLGSGGKTLWNSDASTTERAVRWGALLRSQKQNAQMCQVQYRLMQRAQANESSEVAEAERLASQLLAQEQEARVLEERLMQCRVALQASDSSSLTAGPATAHQRSSTGVWDFEATEMRHEETLVAERESLEVERLRTELQNLQQNTQKARAIVAGANSGVASMPCLTSRGSLEPNPSLPGGPGGGGLGSGGMDTGERDAQAQAEAFRAEFEQLQLELEAVGEAMRGRIKTAQEKLRRLREERDQAIQTNENLAMSNKRLAAEHERQVAENAKLAEEKESLIHIMEDLHESCKATGLPTTAMGLSAVETSDVTYSYP